MDGSTTTVMSLISIISIVCLLVGGMLLLNVIQKAFDTEGVLWGLISIFYPPGTYFYCQRDWNERRGSFVQITALLLVGAAFWLVAKFSTS